ncbi:MAG: DUF4389 domain-containing protein, partial [Gammaproteobacteria bacterium]|nr:DUF4389 domain-containing protein [Gammaproteobacteria bacterium]
MIKSLLLIDKSRSTTMQKDLKEKLLVKEKWIRGLLMLLFAVIKYIVSFLIYIIALFQFVTDLLTG